MDSTDFRSLDYINQIFPSEQSLSEIDDVIAKLQCEYSLLDENIHNIVCCKANEAEEENFGFETAQKIIQQLQTQITNLFTNAKETEERVKQITTQIKRMDYAKKNLISSITTLNHLQILIQGIEDLNRLIEKRSYKEMLNPLQAVLEINQHFKKYQNIAEINALSGQVCQIKVVVSHQIKEDFKQVFTTARKRNPLSQQDLSDACLIASVLDSSLKRELLKQVLSFQLREYPHEFSKEQDRAWLKSIADRFTWFKRRLVNFERSYFEIFPSNWKISEEMSLEFCSLTRNDLSAIMSERSNEIDVRILMFAITKTQIFEREMSHKFSAKFEDLIGICFKPYLHIFVSSIDQNLASLIEGLIESSRKSQASLLSSSGELFMFFKKCMVQCPNIGNALTFYDLSKLFKKYLTLYAEKNLGPPLPASKPKLTQSLGSSMSSLTKDIQNMSIVAGKVLSTFVSSDSKNFSKPELKHILCVLQSADYCLETLPQLENKLNEKIHQSDCETIIDMSKERELFSGIISKCIEKIVRDFELVLDPQLTAMNKLQWQNITNVGDQSSFVSAMIAIFADRVPIIRENLSFSNGKYFTQFCHKFISSFIPKLINSFFSCRVTMSDGLINIVGCEQLLLDTHIVKMTLLDFPYIGSKSERKTMTNYTKNVVAKMNRAEMIIKAVMIPSKPCDAFTAQVVKLLPGITSEEFKQILDMKSVKRSDQIALIEMFNKKINEMNI